MDSNPAPGIIAIVLTILLLVVGGMFVLPTYSVWSAHKHGEAELARASQNRQIKVQESQAKFEAADFDAKAEVRRAEGVAQANKIIGDSLKNNEAYLRYLFVNNLAETKDQIIYVPTEAGLPILESGRQVRPAVAAQAQ